MWPARTIGTLDGIPLDRRIEAIAIGLLFPTLCYLHPGFLRTRAAHALALSLVAIKIASAIVLTQEGWCGRVITSAPVNADGGVVQLAWDARADWRAGVPRCSAIVARGYPDVQAFPAWFLNLSGPTGRPPDAAVALAIDGYISPTEPGTLTFVVAPGHQVFGAIDDRAIDVGANGIPVAAGSHRLRVSTILDGAVWRFEPLWNGSDVFTSVLTTTAQPRPIDRVLSSATRVAIGVLCAALLAWWTFSAARSLALPGVTAAWLTTVTVGVVAAGLIPGYTAGRFAVLALVTAMLVPLPRALRTARGAFLLVGVPWLALFAANSLADVGRFSLFTPGDDFTLFQRFTYRIYMQGFWLEGGQWTFWNQPLYRWLIGPVHLIFGDSSVGERYLDAMWLIVGAEFAFLVCNRVASFRWGIAAAALTLATIALGPSWWIVGRDLSEITAAGFAYAAALLLITDRGSSLVRIAIAALLAVLSFYTRLNHLLWLVGLTALLLPLDVPAAALWRPRLILSRLPLGRAVVIPSALAAGLFLLAWRTWYYTGTFSALLGTQRELLATIRPEDTLPMAIVHLIESLLVIVTVQDPPRFDPRALLIIAGVVIALLALVRVPVCRDVPAALAIFCVAGLAGALVARGTAYIGRFSIHQIPIAVALTMIVGARLTTRDGSVRS